MIGKGSQLSTNEVMAMKNKVLTLVTMFTLLLFGAIFASASQDQSAPAQSTSTEKAAKPAKAHHMAAAKAESLSGTISSVDAEKNLLVVSGSDGVPYNFTVSKSTKITSGGSKAKLSDLQQGKQVSVSFVDMKKKGDWAKSVEVQ
jgi:hypothetical protein